MRHVIPQESVPACLRELPKDAKEQIESTLSNDENSTDEEIVDFWAAECSIPADIGREAVKFRDEYFSHPICVMFPELYEDQLRPRGDC